MFGRAATEKLFTCLLSSGTALCLFALQMAANILLVLLMLRISRSAEPNSKRRRILSAAHVLKMNCIPPDARCLVTDYTHRPEQLTMNVLIQGRESDNANWRNLCEKTIRRKVRKADRSAVPFTMVPSNNTFVFDFEWLGLPIGGLYRIRVATKIKDDRRYCQTVLLNPATTPQVYVNISRTSWRIGNVLFENQSDKLVENVKFAPWKFAHLGNGWGLMDVRKVSHKDDGL